MKVKNIFPIMQKKLKQFFKIFILFFMKDKNTIF